MRKKGTAAEWERLRVVAANVLDDGKAPAEIAGNPGVAAQTVREWRRDYHAGGRAALVGRARPSGRPAELTGGQRLELAGLLVKSPAECGFAGRVRVRRPAPVDAAADRGPDRPRVRGELPPRPRGRHPQGLGLHPPSRSGGRGSGTRPASTPGAGRPGRRF